MYTQLTSGLVYIIINSFMRNPYLTVPYFRTIIFLSFIPTDISLCECYLFSCACIRFIFELGQLLMVVIIVAHNLNFGSVVNMCVTSFLHSP